MANAADETVSANAVSGSGKRRVRSKLADGRGEDGYRRTSFLSTTFTLSPTR
jgi:hypothetical protein